MTPAFIAIEGSHVALGTSNRRWLAPDAANLPLSAFLSLPLLFLAISWMPRERTRWPTPLFSLLLGSAAAIGVTSFLIGGRTGTLLELGQVLVPMTYFLLGTWFARVGLRGVVVKSMAIALAGFALLVAFATVIGPVDQVIGYADMIGPLHISKSLRFFPSGLAVMAVLIIPAGIHGERWARQPIAIAGLVSAVFILWRAHSRTAWLILLLGVFIAITARLVRRSRHWQLTSALGAILSAIAVLYLATGARSVPRAVERTLAGVATDQNRLDAVTVRTLDVLAKPFGSAFAPGNPLARSEFFVNTENQFGDFGSRGGVILLALFGLLAIGGTIRSWRLARRPAIPEDVPLGAATAALLVTSLLQNNFTELYVGATAWLLLGMVFVPTSPAADHDGRLLPLKT